MSPLLVAEWNVFFAESIGRLSTDTTSLRRLISLRFLKLGRRVLVTAYSHSKRGFTVVIKITLAAKLNTGGSGDPTIRDVELGTSFAGRTMWSWPYGNRPLDGKR